MAENGRLGRVSVSDLNEDYRAIAREFCPVIPAKAGIQKAADAND